MTQGLVHRYDGLIDVIVKALLRQIEDEKKAASQSVAGAGRPGEQHAQSTPSNKR